MVLYCISIPSLPHGQYGERERALIGLLNVAVTGLMMATFLGVIWESAFPSFGPKEYHNAISNGRIALVFNCPLEIHTQVHDLLAALGAEWVHRTEATEL